MYPRLSTKCLVATTKSVDNSSLKEEGGPLCAKTVSKGFKKEAEFEVGFLE